MRRLRHLTSQHRTAATNRLLGGLLVSKISSSQIRTTHMTGVITDIGIELGKMFYWNHSARPPESRVRANRMKLRLFGTLLAMFITGGLVGAIGFKYVGFVWVMPLALLLLALSLPPLWADFQRLNRLRKPGWRGTPGEPSLRRPKTNRSQKIRSVRKLKSYKNMYRATI